MHSRPSLRPSRGPPSAIPWQFSLRAAAVVAGLALLLVVDVHGVAFYVAWALIGLALICETAATIVYWRRTRDNEPPNRRR
ncbi:MAG TPA: hypothetical protein VN213_07080 [Solirubrobacteraceae bacterium]|nr:hypothetical protein [Solirubrobacteraceae bacterium]